MLTGLISCKKDWLKPQPLSFYEADLTYVDAAAMRAALVACARNLRLEYYGDNPPILLLPLFLTRHTGTREAEQGFGSHNLIVL